VTSLEEFKECATLLYKTQKAICNLPFIHKNTEEVVHKNMRIGVGVTGICQSLDKIEWLNECYKHLRDFDKEWSKKNGHPSSIRLTTVKPSGTLSLLSGSTPGVHPAYSQYYIRRIRMSSDDGLVTSCKEAGYPVEYVKRFDGTEDRSTVVIEFPCTVDEGTILAKDMSAVNQLDLVKKMQRLWSDNSVSVTVYYHSEELDEIKEWMEKNYEKSLKTVSFLLHREHGFRQAPYEEINKDQYEKMLNKIKPVSYIESGEMLSDIECEGGVCPVR